MCEECDRSSWWGHSPVRHCDQCGTAARVGRTGDSWASLPAGWLVAPAVEHDATERYACSTECATANDLSYKIWESMPRAAGPSAALVLSAWLDEVSREHGTPDWRQLFSKHHRRHLEHWTSDEEIVKAVLTS